MADEPQWAQLAADGALVALVFDEAGLPDGHSLEALPADYWQRGFYLWDGTAFVDDLAAAQTDAWERVKAKREAMKAAGCVTPLGPMDTDPDSLAKVNGAVTMALLARLGSQPFSLDWTMADDVTRTHDADTMIAAGSAVGLHIAACHEVGRALRDQIEAAASVAEVIAIDIEGAPWPAGPSGEGPGE